MKSIITPLIVWVITVILFFVWGRFFGSLKPSIYKTIADAFVIIDVIVGVIAFGLTLLFTIISVIGTGAKHKEPHTKTSKKRTLGNIFKRLIKIALTILFLPIYALHKVIKEKSKPFDKIVKFFIILLLVSPIYFGFELIVFNAVGVIPLAPNQISGHSMLPTLKDNEYITWISYRGLPKLLYSLHRDDLITYSINKPDGKVQAQVKRVIGLPGDRLRLESGYIYVNHQKLDEPYLEQPKSTYGGSYLSDCKEIEVPKENVFVMGDNRKRSTDSRFEGFVPTKNIISFFPYSLEFIYKSRRHQFTQKDYDQEKTDISQYYDLLNKYRAEHKLAKLLPDSKLEKVSSIIIQELFKRNETPLKMTPADESLALNEAGYYNVKKWYIYGQGYFNADELLKYFENSPQTNDQLLNSEYDDTGLAVQTGKLNDCETQIVFQSFGGYVPPNYSKSDIDSWEKSLKDLNGILPSWENLKNYSLSYNRQKQQIDRLLDIIHIRIVRIQQIVTTMDNNQWLTAEENNWIKEEQALFNEEESLAKQINSSFSWQH